MKPGVPICGGVAAGTAPEGPLALPLIATKPPAAAPPATARMAIHFRPEPPLRTFFAAGASETYWLTRVPARTPFFTTVTRTWYGPVRRPATKSCTDARPSGVVVRISVRMPRANVAPGPASGMRKLTAAPSTGRPVSSVISTTTPRLLLPPATRIAPSPSTTRMWRRF